MSTYQLCKNLIQKNSKVVNVAKLDVFLLANRITENEYVELVEMLNAEEDSSETEE